jgi:hypothetical protein
MVIMIYVLSFSESGMPLVIRMFNVIMCERWLDAKKAIFVEPVRRKYEKHELFSI